MKKRKRKVKSKKAKVKRMKVKIKSKKKKSPKRKARSSRPKAQSAKPKAKKVKKEPMASLLLPLNKVKEVFRTRYGFFLYDGSEYVITAPESPNPWANIITNDNYGFIVTQTGGGFSFKNGVSDKVTGWSGDLNNDSDGKFFYIRDNKTQQIWSAAWNPVRKKPDFYEVRYGVGYTNITNRYAGIINSIVCFASSQEPVEIWQLRIRNILDIPRSLSIFSYLEWYFPALQDNNEKAFLKTSFDHDLSAVYAYSANGEVKFHSVSKAVSSFTTDKKAFLGVYGKKSSPRSVEKGMCFKEEGRYVDPAACLHVDLDFEAGQEYELIFVIGSAPDLKTAQTLIKKYKNVKEVEGEFSNMGSRWGNYLKKSMNIKTPDEGANILNNNWFRYQAISSVLTARGCYYRPEGLVRFKDFLLNSLVFLAINAEICKKNILECVKHQYADGNVLTYWDPLTGNSKASAFSDEPLWLIFAISEYIKETADISILREKAAYLDAPADTVLEHCIKALERTLATIPKKGLPAIMQGDCNCKLDKIGSDSKGSSVWLGEFLYYTLNEFSKICKMGKDDKEAGEYAKQAKQLKDNINKLFKGYEWYPAAITSKGAIIGKPGKNDSAIFLNPQTWAVISGVVEGEDAKKLMDVTAKHLYKNHGPIALTPSYSLCDSSIGTLTCLAPGVEENGGTNIEFASWAVWAEVLLGRSHNAWDIYSRLNPVHRAHSADIYEMEPFVASCYIDGQDAVKFGQARYSWYGRSPFWLNKILTEQILGIKPTVQGLFIDPCIPKRWSLFKVYRTFRGSRYIIDVINRSHVSSGIAEILIDGKKIKSNILPVFKDEKTHYVRVTMGKPVK
ncbi:MAG: hypothetical protein V2A72_00390 [Candidatus Omnitrophota bacterium]